MRFSKYHGLGNDYIVIEPSESGGTLMPEQVRLICHRNYGIGSDGILLGPLESPDADFGLRIFNPDGSEAEKSGNGLRIFSRYLWDTARVQQQTFSIMTAGGRVTAQVADGGQMVSVEMGKVSFDSTRIPVDGPGREVLNETLKLADTELRYCAATIGNPHCIVLCDDPQPEMARSLGPLIENNPLFPNRTNVQFMSVLDTENIRIEIWERGAGYTLASGSSSCAAAAVAHRLGLCGSRIQVHMPGGTIRVSISEDFSISMVGPVVKVCDGMIAEELFSLCLPEFA